ncbi:MAG: FliA/WhiG family RNA polymerase sigma factor [Armatimonadota bacterium]|nr:FliA/WhiG family RNA polymerase sigma factor [Armatimonadota bacterium]MDR7401536.1 FliA/WhiG family RNA polymerase sigma factor [Armatimonadota bacterium]MDR7403278.1 FliA/WhiG family RNA polymerase sigma factor [Armatimonadota bacterium]MDR7437652.1 FliA/WhiG family RNA polymerase sigma factor [Armatimonadota bacterium]MDR7471656.1 FliA/WhiG family RNA polymerase sigma factor [Armatimonadota bacterium]
MADGTTSELWSRFRSGRSPDLRERLALAYLPLVRALARQMAVRMPASVKSEDLEGYGMIGLLEAIDRFDPDRGIPFEAFARLRIRGAMYDYLRTLDLLPRVARRHVHRLQAQARTLARSLGRPPTGREVVAATGWEEAAVERIRADAAAGQVLSLEEIASSDQLPDSVIRDVWGDTLARMERQERDRTLWRAIQALPARHKLVVGLYYCEGLTLAEIGRVLGVTESRVSQMRAEALGMLRTHLALRSWMDGAPAPLPGRPIVA